MKQLPTMYNTIRPETRQKLWSHFEKFLQAKSSRPNLNRNPCNWQFHERMKDFPKQILQWVQVGHMDSAHLVRSQSPLFNKFSLVKFSHFSWNRRYWEFHVRVKDFSTISMIPHWPIESCLVWKWAVLHTSILLTLNNGPFMPSTFS